MPSRSSIQEWLDFNGTLPTAISACQNVTYNLGAESLATNLSIIPCADVCTYSWLLLEGTHAPENLVTCGLWATIINPYLSLSAWSMSPYQHPVLYSAPANLNRSLRLFDSVGILSTSFEQYAATTDMISLSLTSIYRQSRSENAVNQGMTAAGCTKSALFPMIPDPATSYSNTIASLRNCLDAICAPPKFNSDLAGIGVFSSVIMQSAIVIAAFCSLFLLDRLPYMGEKSRKRHTTALVTALVDFHEHQCYFAGSIQIAALVAFKNSGAYNLADIDINVLAFLAFTGTIPVVFVLACLAHYGEQSWYLLILSLSSFLLASGIHAISLVHPYSNTHTPWHPSVGPDQQLVAAYSSLCGSPFKERQRIASKGFKASATALVWTNCAIWAVTCVVKHILREGRHGETLNRLTNVHMVPAWQKSHLQWFTICSKFFVVLAWTFCFVCYFGLCNMFVKRSLVSTTWSFGQIVAISVWIPSIIELLYLEFSK